MITPVTLFKDILPQAILDKIQKYLLVDDNISKALKNYYNKLYTKKLDYEEEYFEKYVYKKCVCPNCPDNGRDKIFKRRECYYCTDYEFRLSQNEYVDDRYLTVVINNPQYNRIQYKEYNENSSDEESVDDMYWYDDSNIWLERGDLILDSDELERYNLN